MMTSDLVIKTHSDYAYLWPIINDTTKHIPELIIYTNNRLKFEFNNNIKVVLYDDKLPYASRIQKLLDYLEKDYLLLSHDVDLVLNFDLESYQHYLELIKENGIDRLSLGVFNNPNTVIAKGNYQVCKLDYNISRNFFTPFDYAPSIYNRKNALKLYSTFYAENYSTLELNRNVQMFANQHLKCYGIQKNSNLNLIYHRGFVYTDLFNFLHVTVKGKFLPLYCYFDLQQNFIDIVKKYSLNKHITFGPHVNIQKNEI